MNRDRLIRALVVELYPLCRPDINGTSAVRPCEASVSANACVGVHYGPLFFLFFSFVNPLPLVRLRSCHALFAQS